MPNIFFFHISEKGFLSLKTCPNKINWTLSFLSTISMFIIGKNFREKTILQQQKREICKLKISTTFCWKYITWQTIDNLLVAVLDRRKMSGELLASQKWAWVIAVSVVKRLLERACSDDFHFPQIGDNLSCESDTSILTVRPITTSTSPFNEFYE